MGQAQSAHQGKKLATQHGNIPQKSGTSTFSRVPQANLTFFRLAWRGARELPRAPFGKHPAILF
jgi:hypothetical protein